MSPGKRHHEGIVTGTILGRDGGRSWTGIDEQLEDAQRSTPPDGLMEQNLSIQLGIFGQEGLASRFSEDGNLPLGGEGRGRRGRSSGLQYRPSEADHDGRLTVLAGDLGTFGAGLDEGAQYAHVGTTFLNGVVQG